MSYADRRIMVYCPLPDMTEEMILAIWDAVEIEFEYLSDLDDDVVMRLMPLKTKRLKKKKKK